MKVTTLRPTAKNVIGRIRYLINEYYRDMEPYKHYSFSEIFDFIKTIPYIPDPQNTELIMRPSLMIQRGGGDCDDKTIAGCSYFKCRGIPTGFSLVSDSPEKPIHHIFTIFENYGKWFDFDATYSHNIFLEKKSWYNRVNFYV